MFAVNMKSLLSLLAVISIITIAITSGPGCANIIPPQGGPRDSIPPVLIKANPEDKTKNFTGKTINFTFDEFVELKETQTNLIVSPIPSNTPSVTNKLNTVTVRIKDTLQPNTTYSFNFGNAINDINESNVLKGFTYTFSTGSYIDSLELAGRVLLAETGKPDSTLIVMLHTSGEDSAVIKRKPRYITRLDSIGRFNFKNLPSDTFYLYALKDEGGSMRYFNDKTLFAFYDIPVIIRARNDSAVLYAWAGAGDKDDKSGLPPLTIATTNRNRGATTDKRLKYGTSITGGKQDLLSNFTITFEQPLRLYDSSKIGFYSDTTYTPVIGYTLEKDSTNKKLQLTYNWKENTLYHLILNKDFADDSIGKKLLKTDTITFTSNKLSDYGSVKLKFRNLDLARNPVLLFILNNTVVKSFPLSSADFSQPLVLPGDYELSLLFDNNKNGKWDTGEFFDVHRQPEIVKPIGRRLLIKAAQEAEIEIEL
jgi:hypothetical protein